jgi:hypothetical protein
MSQVAAARFFGITRTLLWRRENDKAPVPRKRVAAIRRFLDRRVL